MCDKCYRDNLDISIGWQTYDLCLRCVQEINTSVKTPMIKPPKLDHDQILLKMMQGQFTTNMEQNQYKTTVKRMVQRQFK